MTQRMLGIVVGLMLSSLVTAAVPDTEWKAGVQCLEASGLSPQQLLCMKLNKKQLSTVMRAGFLIGKKTRQSWCTLVDDLGLRATAEDARGTEELAGCESDNYMRAFERGGQVVRCMTMKLFMGEVDYNQWGALATHMYYCGELESAGDCAAAVTIAKKLRGRDPSCHSAGNLWRWVQRLDYVRWSLDSVYDDNCLVPAKKMLPYCESVLKNKRQCKSLYGTK